MVPRVGYGPWVRPQANRHSLRKVRKVEMKGQKMWERDINCNVVATFASTKQEYSEA